MVAKCPPDFLVFLYDPTAPKAEARSFVLKQDSTFSEVGFTYIAHASREVVTYELSEFVDANSQAWISSAPRVIDIDVALTLAAERPKWERERKNLFSFLEYLQSVDDPETEPFVSFCYRGVRTYSDLELMHSAQKVAIHLRDVWAQVCYRLRESNSLERFTNIETPVTRILCRRQVLGIRVDSEKIHTKVIGLSAAAAKSRFNLRRKFSILDPSDRGQVASAIVNDPHLAGVVNADEPDWKMQSLLKLFAKVSPLAAELRVYRNSQRTKEILQRFGVTEFGRVHSDFRVAGTVTGRILVRNPSLQNIARSHRDALIPDEGKIFLYPDFKQCEPGILAHDSSDLSLVADYNTGDLYEGLSTALFGDRKHREPSKLLFLFVCYGMAHERVVAIGSSITGLSKIEVERAITGFFNRYPGIDTWRNDLSNIVSEEGKIGTPSGNYRSFPAGATPGAILRGAQSQRIQGTAALILKKIIIEIDQRLPEVDLLLPMHDALLVQVPAKFVAPLRSEIESVFREVYKSYCPSVFPQVTFDTFFHNNQ